MLKMCSEVHDWCIFQGPGAGSYHVYDMDSSIFLRMALKMGFDSSVFQVGLASIDTSHVA